MSTTTTTPETEPTTTETASAPEPPPEDGGAGREAARYRRQLREAEAERDALRAQVEHMQRAEVERLAGHLAKPAAVWAAGLDLPAVLDESGNVSPELATAAISAAVEAFGLAQAPRTPKPDPSVGMSATEETASWADALRG